MRARIALVFIFASLCIQCYALKPSRGNYRNTPDNYNMPYKEVFFSTKDGINLHGWLIQAYDSKHEKSPVIIVAHGDAGNIGDCLFYANFCRIGAHVFLFDYRDFGKSDSVGLDSLALLCPEFLDDIDAAVEKLRQLPEVDPEKIGYIGISLGAILGPASALRNPAIKALALDGLGCSTKEIVKQLKPRKPNICVKNFPGKWEPLKAIGKFKKQAVLIIAGENDVHTTPKMAEKVFQKASTKDKELWIVPGAIHGQNAVKEPQLYYEKISRLFINAFKDSL